jgi:hypothetical protein
VTEYEGAMQIGTVEVLRLRVYPAPGGGDTAVPPGVYPLIREPDGTIRWLMRGRRSTWSQPRVEELGDGMFSVSGGGDMPRGKEIDVPSPGMDQEQFRSFLADPLVRDGGPDQRLRIKVGVPS